MAASRIKIAKQADPSSAVQPSDQTSRVGTATLPEDRLVRIGEVLAFTGMSRSSLYREIARGGFPVQIKIGARASVWLMSEIHAWIQSRVRARDARPPLSDN